MMKVVSYNQHYLPDSIWKRIEPYLPKQIKISPKGRPACDVRKTIEGISGCSNPERAGGIYPMSIPVIRPAGGN
jgi:hypothetical protein